MIEFEVTDWRYGPRTRATSGIETGVKVGESVDVAVGIEPGGVGAIVSAVP
jgi:hypothetical protein